MLRSGVNIPSAPIFPSPSLSAAAIRDLVSDSVSSLAPLSNFWRKNLQDNKDRGEFSERSCISPPNLSLSLEAKHVFPAIAIISQGFSQQRFPSLWKLMVGILFLKVFQSFIDKSICQRKTLKLVNFSTYSLSVSHGWMRSQHIYLAHVLPFPEALPNDRHPGCPLKKCWANWPPLCPSPPSNVGVQDRLRTKLT